MQSKTDMKTRLVQTVETRLESEIMLDTHTIYCENEHIQHSLSDMRLWLIAGGRPG